MEHTPEKREKKIVLFAVCIGLAVLSAACFTAFYLVGHTMRSQRAAEEFRGENEQLFAQVSAYFTAGHEITEEQVYSFRSTLDGKLADASLETPENGSLYADAYSAVADITVTGEKGSAQAKATGIGGDFFLFHPLFLRSGSYISGDDLMHDGVVLDEETAWRLFGGVELEGLTVIIGNEPYRIAGVISREDDFADKKADTGEARIYMAYDMLNKLSPVSIGCYELVCADPVKGFAIGCLRDGFKDSVTVECSARFSVSKIFSVLGDFGKRSMNTAAVELPYWENAARYVEDILAVILIFAVLFAVFPAGVLLVTLYKLAGEAIGMVKRSIPAAMDRASERRYKRQIEKAAAGKDR